MKKLLLIGLVFLLAFTSSTVYAYWDNNKADYSLDQNHNNIIVKQINQSNDGKFLVPQGVILGVNDTEELTYIYEVSVPQTMKLDTRIINTIVTKNNEALNNMESIFDFDIQYQVVSDFGDSLSTIINDTDNIVYLVHITVSMNEPQDYEQFVQLAHSQMTFDVQFSAFEDSL